MAEPGAAERRTRTAGAAGALAPADVPSSKYPELAEPPKALLAKASEQPKPLLPKFKPLRSWQATRREEVPLKSGLIGGRARPQRPRRRQCARACSGRTKPRYMLAGLPSSWWPPITVAGAARAGKEGELVGSDGSVYRGEVLAGRPHGRGTLSIPKVRGAAGRCCRGRGAGLQGRCSGLPRAVCGVEPSASWCVRLAGRGLQRGNGAVRGRMGAGPEARPGHALLLARRALHGCARWSARLPRLACLLQRMM
jgi:hypothetical protein